MALQGHLYIVSAPSGAGKTSLLKSLVGRLKNLQISVSHTTRERRAGEVDGKDYHFTQVELFKSMISENAFLEYAEVFGNYYGTSKIEIEKSLSQGIDVILEIDWQGARQIRDMMPEAISIFVLPPSLEALQQRLTHRGQDDKTIIHRRMLAATEEMRHYDEYQYLIINDVFETALNELNALISSHRLTLKSQKSAHQKLIDSLI